jgi:hypothetical protein
LREKLSLRFSKSSDLFIDVPLMKAIDRQRVPKLPELPQDQALV